MPDITKCTNKDCQLSFSCYRFKCKPSEYSQSYQKFIPLIDEILDEVECNYYIEKASE